ncbi:hypothetical protein CB1_001437012 [Camelus ferus]|nr:hypothetical protein CB1_001437012 [Camelus ferus]
MTGLVCFGDDVHSGERKTQAQLGSGSRFVVETTSPRFAVETTSRRQRGDGSPQSPRPPGVEGRRSDFREDRSAGAEDGVPQGARGSLVVLALSAGLRVHRRDTRKGRPQSDLRASKGAVGGTSRFTFGPRVPPGLVHRGARAEPLLRWRALGR